MMNILWCVMLLLGFITALFTGSAEKLTDAMTGGCLQAVTLCLELLGAYMLWMGLMEIADELGVVGFLSRKMKKPLSRLMPDAGDACAPIALNLAANFFGMGSAAQPFGFDAMARMQAKNPKKDTATNGMCLFIAMNASAIDLLPMTVIALRTSAGAKDPASIVVPTFAASVAAFCAAVIWCKAAEKRCS